MATGADAATECVCRAGYYPSITTGLGGGGESANYLLVEIKSVGI